MPRMMTTTTTTSTTRATSFRYTRNDRKIERKFEVGELWGLDLELCMWMEFCFLYAAARTR